MNKRNAKKLRFVLLACFLFLGSNVFALPFDMILSGDPTLEDLRFLSLESGRPFLSFTPPLAPAEVENFLDSIDPSLLREPAQQAYYRIRERLIPQARLSFTSNAFSTFFNINSMVEGRVRFNTDLDWHPLNPDIPPMVSFPIRFFFADAVKLYLEPFIAVGVPYFETARIFGTNLHYNIEGDIDPTMPHRAFFAAGGQWWNFQLGRDRLFWGTGHTGSFSFSDNANYFEYARLSFFSARLKYSLIINQMPLYRIMQRHFYLHRLDFALSNTLSIGIMEGRMVGNSPLNLRYINPLMIFLPHAEDESISFFSLEANWNIARSFSVYGQFVMTDFALPNGNSGRSPSGLGFMAGLNFTRSFNTWASVFFLEYMYTYPYLYMGSSSLLSFIQRNKITVSRTRYYFIGYPRDTMALTLGARFFRGNSLSFEGELAWVSRGEYATSDVLWTWVASGVNERSLSGTPENNYIASFAARWQPFTHFAFGGSITGILSNNNNNSGTNIAGGQVAFSVIFQY